MAFTLLTQNQAQITAQNDANIYRMLSMGEDLTFIEDIKLEFSASQVGIKEGYYLVCGRLIKAENTIISIPSAKDVYRLCLRVQPSASAIADRVKLIILDSTQSRSTTDINGDTASGIYDALLADFDNAIMRFTQRIQYAGVPLIDRVPTATKNSKGTVIAGQNLSINDQGVLNVVIPKAKASTLGGVKVGDGLSITDDGTLSANVQEIPKATSSALGGVKIGNNIIVDSDGRINTHAPYTLPVASNTTLGGVKVGTTVSVINDFLNVSDNYGQATVEKEEKTLKISATSKKFSFVNIYSLNDLEKIEFAISTLSMVGVNNVRTSKGAIIATNGVLTQRGIELLRRYIFCPINCEFVVNGNTRFIAFTNVDIDRSVFNVLDYKTGDRNDTAAINAAFDACHANGGGIVYFPPKVYEMTTYPNFYSNTHIIGVPGKSILTYPAVVPTWYPTSLLKNNTTSSDTQYNATENVIIEGLTFSGRDDVEYKSTMLGLGHAKNITIKNCIFQKMNGDASGHCHYIELNACKDIVIKDCFFDKAKNRGAANGAGTQSEYVNIDVARSGHYGNPDWYNSDGTECLNIEIVGCTFKSYSYDELGTTHRTGPAIGGHATVYTQQVRIHDCLFEGDWVSLNTTIRPVIEILGSNVGVAIYNNVFRTTRDTNTTKTYNLLKANVNPPHGIHVGAGNPHGIIHDNLFIDYDPYNLVIKKNNDSKAIVYNNYCYFTYNTTSYPVNAMQTYNSGGVKSVLNITT